MNKAIIAVISRSRPEHGEIITALERSKVDLGRVQKFSTAGEVLARSFSSRIALIVVARSEREAVLADRAYAVLTKKSCIPCCFLTGPESKTVEEMIGEVQRELAPADQIS